MPDYVDVFNEEMRRSGRRDPLSVAMRTRGSTIPAANRVMGGLYPPGPGTYFDPRRYAGASPGNIRTARTSLAREYQRDLEFNRVANPRAYAEEIQARALGPRGGDIVASPGTAPNVGDLVGYYDRTGRYLGPLYDPTGRRLRAPKGATGIRGTGGIPQDQDWLANVRAAQGEAAPSREFSRYLGYYGTPPSDTSRMSPTERLVAEGFTGGREGGGVTRPESVFQAFTGGFSRFGAPGRRFADLLTGYSMFPSLAGRAAPMVASLYRSIFPAVRGFGGSLQAARPSPTPAPRSPNPYSQYGF